MDKKRTIMLLMTIAIFLSLGCSTSSLPFISTQTPYPTYTLVPETFTVKVREASSDLACGGFYFTEDQATRFITLTLEYTYNGEGTKNFYPASVLLLDPEDSSYAGGVLYPTVYQPENSTEYLDFYSQNPILTYIKSDQTKIEHFCYSTNDLVTDHYLLQFPEMEPVEVEIKD